MKFVGLIGTNAKKSTNRQLVAFMQREFAALAEIELLEIKDVPMFNETQDQTNSEVIQRLNSKILAADGVIIATPEHNHSIPSALKSVLEWLSFNLHPFDGKPVMIVAHPTMCKAPPEHSFICARSLTLQVSMRQSCQEMSSCWGVRIKPLMNKAI